MRCDFADSVYPFEIMLDMEKFMEAIIYIAIFLSGTVFGSFFTLAVYRIPRKEDITHVRSHCTSCNHELNFLDLIPVLSYIFLGGKCRYCGEKIRIRYLLLEIMSGLVFLLVALTHGITNIIWLIFAYLFFTGMFIIGGIDKEKLEIPNGLCIYNLCISLVYIGYLLYIKVNILDNIFGMIVIPLLLFVLNKLVYVLMKADNKKYPIGLGDIKYLSLIGLMFGFPIQVISIVLSLLITMVGVLIHKYKEIPWGYYLTISTIAIVIFEPYIKPIIELI